MVAASIATARAFAAPRVGLFRDLVTLTKPRVTALVVATAAFGARLAPGEAPAWKLACAMLGTALVVGAANALNMWWERDTDALMARTHDRPLAAGRMSPGVGLAFGVALAAGATPLLLRAGLLVAALGLGALAVYVLAYTPLKRRSPLALPVGALAGAAPPAMGWVSVTGALDAGCLTLFALLLLWQIPHFAAIAHGRAGEYARAGLRVVAGAGTVRAVALASTALLSVASLLPWALGMAGPRYAAVAAALDAVFLAIEVRGAPTRGWARRVFLYSIAYLVAVLAALLVGRTF